MRICEFDGTETEGDYCPTCKDYKGLTTAEEKRTLGMITLGSAIDEAMRLMAEYRENFDDEEEEPND
jgi:hypothetical protein